MKKTLYKISTTGKTVLWEIQVEGNKYRTISGQVGGKLITNDWTVCEGMNIGRANETSPSEQAVKEAIAKFTKKKESGYDENLSTAGKAKYFEPMLANKWEDYKDTIAYPFAMQPKLDGIRCVINKDGMFSRNGKPIISAPHIFNSLKKVFDTFPELTLDGELYNHDLKYNFNKIVSLVKKTKPTQEDLDESERLAQYHCYDMFDSTSNKTFEERSKFIATFIKETKYVKIVPTYIAGTESESDKIYETLLEQGYEGGIIRNLDATYENKRTKNLLKRKDFIDEEYKILDIIEGDGNRTGTVGYMMFENKNGRPFKSNVKGDFEYLAVILKNKKKLIGKLATIKYFNLTPDGIPRFPYVIAIRDYE